MPRPLLLQFARGKGDLLGHGWFELLHRLLPGGWAPLAASLVVVMVAVLMVIVLMVVIMMIVVMVHIVMIVAMVPVVIVVIMMASSSFRSKSPKTL